MNIRFVRRLTRAGALALATTAAVGACTSAGAPVTALPGSAGPAAPSVASPTPAGSPPTTPGSVPAPSSPAGSPCLGALIHRIDVSDTGPPWKQLCMTVGGVLRLTNLGPEGFSTSSRNSVECSYEAGVRDCRLLRSGTVKFTITRAHRTRTLTLVIAKASPSSGSSPACTPVRATFTIDAAEGGPPGRAMCMRADGVVRVVNLGPDGFQVSPSDAVVCWYEAAVRECRFTRPATVTFTTTHGDSAPRTQRVVAVR